MLLTARAMSLPLGTPTDFGEVSAVGLIDGERYYWLVDKTGGVAMVPWFVVEPSRETPLQDA